MYAGGHPAAPRHRPQPRVFPDQRTQFQNQELFRKLSRESDVSITLPIVPYIRNKILDNLAQLESKLHNHAMYRQNRNFQRVCDV